MKKIVVGSASEFSELGHKTFDIDGAEIGVFVRDGAFYAYENVCPHRAGPVCQGRIMPRTIEQINPDQTHVAMQFSRDKSHIVCPWHGLEFDITTGVHPGNARLRLRRVEVEVENGEVIISIGEQLATHQDRIALVAAQSGGATRGGTGQTGSVSFVELADAPKG